LVQVARAKVDVKASDVRRPDDDITVPLRAQDLRCAAICWLTAPSPVRATAGEWWRSRPEPTSPSSPRHGTREGDVLVATATERAVFGRSGIYDVTVRCGERVSW